MNYSISIDLIRGIIFFVVISSYSCSKENASGDKASLNKTIFFTINFKGKSLTTYGVNSNLPSPASSYDFNNIEISNAAPPYTYIRIRPTDYTTQFPYLQNPQIQLHLDGGRMGNSIGEHSAQGYFIDKTDGNKNYQIWANGQSKLIIESATDRIAKGKMTLTLYDLTNSNTPIPATGSFALWIK